MLFAVGTHSLTAIYSGDAAHTSVTSGVYTQVVTVLPGSSITLTSNINPSSPGQSVTFVATVFPSDATGVVTFLDGGNKLGDATLGPYIPVSGANPVPTANFTTSSLSVGLHSITGLYVGDSKHGASAVTIQQTVR